MSGLEEAIAAAEARKEAALGIQPGAPARFGVTASEELDRAVFSGFDLDYEELTVTALRAARIYHGQAATMPLLPLFISCWCDGILVGLMAASRAGGEGGDAAQ